MPRGTKQKKKKFQSVISECNCQRKEEQTDCYSKVGPNKRTDFYVPNSAEFIVEDKFCISIVYSNYTTYNYRTNKTIVYSNYTIYYYSTHNYSTYI